MNEIRKSGADFIGYEYKELTASGEQASFYLDCDQSFGWMPDDRMEHTKSKLVLKRERKIVNKVVTELAERLFNNSQIVNK